MSAWNHMNHELYLHPQTLDFKTIRSHEDLKLILPFIEVLFSLTLDRLARCE